MAGGEKAELLATAEKVISEDVIPASSACMTFFTKNTCPAPAAAWAPVNCRTANAFTGPRSRNTHRGMTPQEIHDIGLEQVARIRSEMDDIISELGFEGDFAAFLEFLRTDPQFYAKTPKELLAHASYYAKKIDGRLPMLFGHLPRQPYGVAPVPAESGAFLYGWPLLWRRTRCAPRWLLLGEHLCPGKQASYTPFRP